MSAWGDSGIAGNAATIFDAVNHVVFQLSTIFEIENEIVGATAPEGLESVKNALSGMTQECVKLCLIIADEIELAVLQGHTESGDPVRQNLLLSLDHYFSQASQEIQKFNERLHS